MSLRRSLLPAAVALACLGVSSVQADTLTDFFKQSKIDGQLRSYYFSRIYGAPGVPDQNAFSLGGMLNVETAPFLGGFGVGASFYTAHSLGANDLTGAPGYPHLDATLMGPRYSINALGQAYIQFKQPWLLVRAGDQVINTPWLNNSDSRILPATYQALFADVTPVKDLHIYAMREFRWKSRTSADYFKNNLYYVPTYSGDTMYGGSAAVPLSAPQAQGTLAFGASYGLMGLKAQAWYYDFYQFANMFYGDATYTLKTGTGFDPFVAGQFVREWKGNSLLNHGLGAGNVNGVAGNTVDNTSWGAQVGLNYPGVNSLFNNGQVTWSYNEILLNQGSIGGGALISPYTVGYATDPLYTTSMIRGLVELGPGNGWKVKWTQNLLNKQVLLMAAFARYHTYFNGNSNDAYLDVTYFLPGMFKGLSIRDRVEVSNGSSFFANGAGGNKGHSFIYNRVMLAYSF